MNFEIDPAAWFIEGASSFLGKILMLLLIWAVAVTMSCMVYLGASRSAFLLEIPWYIWPFFMIVGMVYVFIANFMHFHGILMNLLMIWLLYRFFRSEEYRLEIRFGLCAVLTSSLVLADLRWVSPEEVFGLVVALVVLGSAYGACKYLLLRRLRNLETAPLSEFEPEETQEENENDPTALYRRLPR